MSKSKNWAYSQLSEEFAMIMRIEVVPGVATGYRVSQFVASFSLNGIPNAVCALAIGRNIRKPDLPKAQIHNSSPSLHAMLPVEVELFPTGEYDPDGTEWGEKGEIIFRGFFQGFSYQKVRGKVVVVANLVHWMYDLGFSSTVSSISHPSNPVGLLYQAVHMQGSGLQSGTSLSGEGGLPAYTSLDIPGQLIQNELANDIWSAYKNFLCLLAGWEPLNPSNVNAATGLTFKTNDKAMRALARFENPGEPTEHCTIPPPEPHDPLYSKPLPFPNTDISAVLKSLNMSLGEMTFSVLAQNTFWDVLVGQFAPMFGLAIVPMVERGLVIADTPGYRGKQWRTIRPDEYISISQSAKLDKPLRAVGLADDFGMMARPENTEAGIDTIGGYGGIWGPDGDIEGAIIYVRPPAWLRNMSFGGQDPSLSTGAAGGRATGGGKGDPPKAGTTTGDTYKTLQDLAVKYSRWIFVRQALRGRVGQLTGKLRFDVAPGSMLKIEGAPETFIGGGDDGIDELAGTLYASVSKVTIEINAESRLASTSFQLTHIRSARENNEEATSTDEHPLFFDKITTGAPLVEAYNFNTEVPEPTDVATA